MKNIKRSEALKRYWKKYKLEHGNRKSYERTEAHKKKMSLIKKNQVMTEEWKKNISKYHADVTGENNPMYGRRGEFSVVYKSKNPNWKGGVTKLTEKIRKSPEYRDWRSSVYKRDRFTCVMCGYKGKHLNADHIKPFSLFPELRFDIGNGRTLCIPCHKTTDSYLNSKIYRQQYER